MNALLIESIAFAISIIAFLYGIIKINKISAPLYFKLIINAVGCYALEELWAIVNAICDFENDIFSVRLIGIFGCFCTFLTASVTKIIKEDNKNNKLAFIAPLIVITLFLIYIVSTIKEKTILHILISFTILVPLIIDSYYELKYILTKDDKEGYLKCIKPINILILIEYTITLSYLFIKTVNIELILDISSAVIMLLIVLTSIKGANKWKTLT